ncbi:MAG: helix-turn-helix domain-containing protein [Solirubrobacteraceae bacterium]
MSGDERREQLLDVTAELIAERGFQGVTILAVAQRAAISRPIVYEHFGDLRGLLEAVVTREMGRALIQVSESALVQLNAGNPVELLLQSLGTYLRAVEHYPHTWRLVLMPPEGAPENLRQSIVLGRAGVLRRLTEAVAAGLPAEDESPDAELTARILSTIADEYARLILTDPASYTAERLLAHARWFLEQFPA